MIEIITLIFLLIAAWTDYKTFTIPNRLQIVATICVIVSVGLLEPNSWHQRAIVAVLLSGFALVGVLLNQTGGGDLKMLFWVGAGLSSAAVAGLAISAFFMVVYSLVKLIKRQKVNWIPFAPFLASGVIVWEYMRTMI